MLLIWFLLDDWQLNRLKDSIWRLYLFWICVINCIEDSIALSLKDNLPIVFLNLHIHVHKNISRFVRKIRNKLSAANKKKNVFLVNDFAIQNENEIECIGLYNASSLQANQSLLLLLNAACREATNTDFIVWFASTRARTHNLPHPRPAC